MLLFMWDTLLDNVRLCGILKPFTYMLHCRSTLSSALTWDQFWAILWQSLESDRGAADPKPTCGTQCTSLRTSTEKYQRRHIHPFPNNVEGTPVFFSLNTIYHIVYVYLPWIKMSRH